VQSNSDRNPARRTTASESIVVAVAFVGIVGVGAGLRIPSLPFLGSLSRSPATSSVLPAASVPAGLSSPTIPTERAFATQQPTLGGTASPTPKATTTVVVAAGDIACDINSPSFNGGVGRGNNCRAMATAGLIDGVQPDAVLALGDNQYEDGGADQWLRSYELSWGRFKSITHPVAGNHEYLACATYDLDCSYAPRAAGYSAYFGEAAGPTDQFWYSFDLASWHVVALNSNCTNERVACGTGSAQDKWLRADLAAHPVACTLAFFHHPRFSSGQHGDDATLDTLYRDLYDGGVDVLLAGHDHDYERFQPLDPSGRADAAHGIRNFVVGTGGRNLRRGTLAPRPITEAANDETLGIIRLSLEPGVYSWTFIPIPGETFTDSGRSSCH